MLKKSLLKNKTIISGLCMILALIALSGCSKTNKEQRPWEEITFTDSLNRQVTVKKSPERVAALIGSFADVWLLAGGEICATAEDTWEDFGLELENCVNIGGAHSPNFEALLSANPDFVIASASTASNVKLKESLENAGICVAYFDVDCFDDYIQMLDICTDITGKKELFEKNGQNIKKQIDEILKEYKDTDIPEEKRTILLLRTSSGSVKAKGSEGTILGEMLDDFGCINIADNDKTLLDDISIESIIKQEPYRIFTVAMGDEAKAEENLLKMMEENPAWGTLDAVKENRLYMMDRKLFNIKPNADWAKSYEKLSEILLDKTK